jgi:ABC-type molybdate transport system substrate-binding protein
MAARLSVALAVIAIMTAPAMAEEMVLLHAAGSLRAALTEVAKAWASAPAYQFAMFILSAEGQRTLAKHGFAAPALPQ